MQTIVIDTETTGFNPEFDEVLQVSIIGFDGSVLFNEYIKPTKNESWEEAQRVNGISPEMVKDCPTFEERREAIQQIFDTANMIIGYNGDFDLSFMAYNGIKLPDCNCFDVMKEFAPIYGEWSEYHGEYKYKSLSVCAGYYGYEWEGKAHDSLEDCKATLYCYKKMIGECMKADSDK